MSTELGGRWVCDGGRQVKLRSTTYLDYHFEEFLDGIDPSQFFHNVGRGAIFPKRREEMPALSIGDVKFDCIVSNLLPIISNNDMLYHFTYQANEAVDYGMNVGYPLLAFGVSVHVVKPHKRIVKFKCSLMRDGLWKARLL